MDTIPTFAAEAEFLKRLVANRSAQRVMGMRARATHRSDAEDGFRRLATGLRPRTLANAIGTEGRRYASDLFMDIFADRRAGDTAISALAVRTLGLLGLDAGAMAVAMFTYGFGPLTIGTGGVRVVSVLRVKDDRTQPLQLDIEIALPRACRWIPNIGLLDMPGPVPEALLASMSGRPLAQMVSHPLLDALGLEIETAFDDNGTTTVHLPRSPMGRIADQTPLRRAT